MRKCLEDNLGAMLKVAPEDLLEDPPGEKEGRNDAKTGSIRNRAVWAQRRVVSNVPDNVWHLRAHPF